MLAENPAGDPASRLEAFLAAHGAVVESLLAKSGAARWRVTRERFAAALEKSADRRFCGEHPTQAEVASYLSSLHVEDLALACACSDGHAPAWEHFVSSHREDLYAAARAIVCSGSAGGAESRARELADSMYAELYLGGRDPVVSAGKPRRSLFEYFHGRSKLSTWLRAILAQRYVDALRAGQRNTTLEEKDEAYIAETLRAHGTPVEADPDRARYLELLQKALEEALAALEPRERLRLAYYYAHGRTLAEIGRILGEHEATVSRQLERARREVRKRVERTLRTGSTTDGTHGGLTDAQIQLCYQYAMEEYPFDLTRALGGSEAPAKRMPAAETPRARRPSE